MYFPRSQDGTVKQRLGTNYQILLVVTGRYDQVIEHMS